jgi:integrase
VSRGVPTVRWNDKKQRWMAFVRFPDGSRKSVERINKADAEADLVALLNRRADVGAPESLRHSRATFNEVIDEWIAAGAPALGPKVRHIKAKGHKSIKQVHSAMDTHVRPAVGRLVVDRTSTDTIEAIFERMDAANLSKSWVNKTWQHLNSALIYGLRKKRIQRNPAADVLLPECRPPQERKSLTLDQAIHLITEVLPADRRPALWLTGLLCGLRPGELLGLRWPYTDIDSATPHVAIDERADFDNDKYLGQKAPKGGRKSKRTIALHPLVVAALQRYREEQAALGHHDPEGFVFTNRHGRGHTPSGGRALMKGLFRRAGFGSNWTTYELRHSFVTLAQNSLGDLQAIADTVGHVSTRTTEGYNHNLRPMLKHAVEAWDALLDTHGDES